MNLTIFLVVDGLIDFLKNWMEFKIFFRILRVCLR